MLTFEFLKKSLDFKWTYGDRNKPEDCYRPPDSPLKPSLKKNPQTEPTVKK